MVYYGAFTMHLNNLDCALCITFIFELLKCIKVLNNGQCQNARFKCYWSSQLFTHIGKFCQLVFDLNLFFKSIPHRALHDFIISQPYE